MQSYCIELVRRINLFARSPCLALEQYVVNSIVTIVNECYIPRVHNAAFLVPRDLNNTMGSKMFSNSFINVRIKFSITQKKSQNMLKNLIFNEFDQYSILVLNTRVLE